MSETKFNNVAAYTALRDLLTKIIDDLGDDFGLEICRTFEKVIKERKAAQPPMESEDVNNEAASTSDEEDPNLESSEEDTTSSSSEDLTSPKAGQKRSKTSRSNKGAKKTTAPAKETKKPDEAAKVTLEQPASRAPSPTPTTSKMTTTQPASTEAAKMTRTQLAPTTTTATAANNNISNNKEPKMPPIFCYSANIAEISRFCKAKNLKVIFKNRNTNSTIINAGTKEAFEAIKRYMKDRKIQHNSFTPKDERKNLLLLKGIHNSFSAIEVEDELRIEGLPVVKVTQYRSKKLQGKTYNNFVVELSKNCNIAEVYTKTLIMNQRVHWERLQTSDIVQCRNCQRFGHVATNCGRQYVCVKCKEEHEPGQCKRKENTGRDVWCANCQKEGHPASYKGCPTLIAKRTFRNKKEAEKKRHQEFAAKSACSITRPELSFAAILRNGSTPPSTSAAPAKQQKKPPTTAANPRKPAPARPTAAKPKPAPSMNLNNEVKRIFGSDLMSVMKKAKTAVPDNYAQLSENDNSSKRTAFNYFMRKNKPDIALISETNVTRRNNINISGYKTFRQDKTEINRGTAIYVMDRLSTNASEVHIRGLTTSEATAIKLELGRSESLTIVSVYFKCNSSARDIQNDLTIINRIINMSTYGLIGGDFNARHHQWFDTTITNEGKAIVDWMDQNIEEHSLVVVSQPKPTFPRTPSILDFFLSTSNFVYLLPELSNYTCTLVSSDSDHEAVQLTVNISQPITLTPVQAENHINYRSLDVERLQRDVEENITWPPGNRNLRNEEIDNAINSLESAVSSAIEAQKVPKTSRDRYQHLPEYIQNLYSHRQRLRKRLQRIHQRELNTINSNYQTVKSELQCVNTMFKNAIQHHNNEQFKKRLQNIKPGPDAFKEINRIVGKKQPLPDVMTFNDTEVTTPAEKAEAFSRSFEKNFQPTPSTDVAFLEEVEASIQQVRMPNSDRVEFSDNNPSTDPMDNNQLCDPDEIAEIIAESKPKKSTGPDGISNYVLKRLPQTVLILITIIINNCLNNCYFPQKWKTAKIVAIPKKGASNIISNYRPISLLSNISKILEEVMLRRLKKFCNERNIIPDMQFGFREAHSTLHPLLKLQSDITAALNSHRVTVGCFLDVEKAFDSVWIEALVHKLRLFGLPLPLTKIVFSFLSSRKFFVEIDNNCRSGIRTIKAGVAQGSKLGPYLYSLMTSDQPTPTDCENLLYADDSLTYSSSISPVIAARRVEAHVNRLYEFYKKWGIRINSAKTELVCFRRPVINGRRSRSATACRNIKVTLADGTAITAKRNAKYLGVNFNEMMKFNPHSKTVLKKANLAFHRVHPLLRKRNGLSKSTKLLIYKQLLRPVISYGFPIWYTISKTAMEKLNIFERKILRISTGLTFDHQRRKHYSNKRVYEEANITPLNKFLIQTSKKLMTKTASHPNPLIRRMTSQERHPEPRYLCALDIPERFPMDIEDETSFYADTGSVYNRG